MPKKCNSLPKMSEVEATNKKSSRIFSCSPIKASIYVYVLLLTLVFLQQASISIKKFMEFEVQLTQPTFPRKV